VLRFRVKPRDDQTPTEVFVTHLKSKLATDVSEEAMKGNTTPVVVFGDINDGQTSNTANILTQQPRFATTAW
jgi:hypothetical protein